MSDIKTASQRQKTTSKPHWLKSKIPTGETLFKIKKELRGHNLYTVCEEAKCPNITKCWATGTATFMILGDTCTRACRFCNVKTGNPNGLLDPKEPEKVAQSIKLMNLDYAVITMVDRDDLPDFGAAHIKLVLRSIRSLSQKTKIEFLGGDMAGDMDALRTVLSPGLEVFAHNIETVKRLSPRVRDARSGYEKSLMVLKTAKKIGQKGLMTKSALMLGLGESREEVLIALQELREHGVDIVTIGQYMQPSKRHLRVKKFVHPETFSELKYEAQRLGFLAVASGPLVRSSYIAGQFYFKAQKKLGE